MSKSEEQVTNEEEEVQLGAGMIEFGEPWSVRIPAAIKKAEELIGPDDWYANDASTIVITATEVALADELWGFANDGPCPPWPDALIAFCEKVEKLT